jgi:hypothetical protein
MDPATLQMFLTMMGRMGQPGQAPGGPQMPTTGGVQAPQPRPIQNVPTDPGVLSHTPGGPAPLDISTTPGGAAPVSAPGTPPGTDSSLAGLSKLGAESITPEDVDLGRSLLGAAPVTPEATGPSMVETAAPAAPPPLAGPSPGGAAGETMAAGAEGGGAPGADPRQAALMKSLFTGLQGVKAPPPITPIMHGGNVGGVKPPDATAKMGAVQSQVPALLQMLFASGGPRGLPVPALGSLLRGA